MKRPMYLKLAILVTLGLSLATGQAPQQATLSVGSATLGELKGQVSIRSGQGATIPAQRGQQLEAESVIETAKGSAVLELQDGSQVLVKSNSRVVLKAPNQGKGEFFELLIGKVMATVKKRLGTAPSFKMGTPTAVITVRGTRFSVEVNKKNKTLVDVYEGLVEVAGVGFENRPVLLRPGFSTTVEHDRAPENPREFHEIGDGMDRRPGERDSGDASSPLGKREGGETDLPSVGRPSQEGTAPARPSSEGSTSPSQNPPSQREPD